MKNPGYRKLGGNDIVREGDVEYTKTNSGISFVGDDGSIAAIPTNHVGCQMCTEEMQIYGNDIYRKLTPKVNAP